MDKRSLSIRSDLVLLLLDWIRPLKSHYSEGYAQLLLGRNSAPYGENDVRLEGYARVLWGLGPLLSQQNTSLPDEIQSEINDWAEKTRTGLINGTDPHHKEYWGEAKDRDHKFVEMAAIANAILMAPDVYWKPLSQKHKCNVFNWLNQINKRDIYGNNWIAFRILVNTLFCRIGLMAWNKEMENDLAVFDSNYEGGGWYHDGIPGKKDYYIPFAMHFYGLLVAKYMNNELPQYCATLKRRAEQFYRDYHYWFDGKGRSVPFGRSLTYRFAHTAAFAAMAFADMDIPIGELRHFVLQNLRFWHSQPIFDNGGILSIGYCYPNLIMSELYNSNGSPYWAFKSFLILALPEEHEFWNCKEVIPTKDKKRKLMWANMIADHTDSEHALLYPAGLYSPNIGNADAKYQKFVYSSAFGFSVSRGTSLCDGAFDSALAISMAGDDYWRTRQKCLQFEVTDSHTRTLYFPIPGVRVESVIVPLSYGHVRIHYISTNYAIDLADSGFAIKKEDGMHFSTKEMIKRTENQVCCHFPWGISGAVSLDMRGEPEIIEAFPNTNLVGSLTLIPTLRCSLNPGEYIFTNYFYGSEKQVNPIVFPQVRATDHGIIIKDNKCKTILSGKKWL